MRSPLENIEPEQLALLAVLVAAALSEGLSPEENASLSAFLITVSDAMILIAAQKALAETVRT